jgi:prephenate dehydrogenase
LRARAAGYETIGIDCDRSHAESARKRGAFDRTAEDETEVEADLLLLAIPVDATVDRLRRYAQFPPRAGTILDVGSVKAPILRAAAGLSNFVGTHPMAGSEKSGPEAAYAELFDGRTWVYDPSARSPHREHVLELIEALGGRPVGIEAQEHDRIVALTSHMPLLLSVELASYLSARLGEPGVRALSGSGLASMTRLAGSSWEMWRSILLENAAPVAQEVRSIATILLGLADDLDRRDVTELAGTFELAASVSQRLAANRLPYADR